MNKNIKKIVAGLALALATGCVHAGTWAHGYYYDGPICTVCDGARVLQHAYGTMVCAHCDGTGIEPPEATVVNTVYVDTYCPPPPPPPPPPRHHRPELHRRPPHPGGHHAVRPAPAPRPAARPARPAASRPQPARRGGGGGHHVRK